MHEKLVSVESFINNKMMKDAYNEIKSLLDDDLKFSSIELTFLIALLNRLSNDNNFRN